MKESKTEELKTSTTDQVEIIKTKNGVPTVIQFQGHRYIRDMQNQVNSHKFRGK